MSGDPVSLKCIRADEAVGSVTSWKVGNDVAKRIVVLGGGTGGTLIANRLRKMLEPKAASITVVDRDDLHIYQPGQVPVALGLARPADIVRSRRRQLRRGVQFRETTIDWVDVAAHQVHLAGDEVLDYDVLIVATGTIPVPEATKGMTGPGWMDKVVNFYQFEGAAATAAALERLDRGRLVVAMVDMPIKCPPAPPEFCLLADWYFHRRGLRDQVEITFVTPLSSVFPAPLAGQAVAEVFAERNVHAITDFKVTEVQGADGQLIGEGGKTVPFDLAVMVPSFRGAEYIGRSPGLGDARDFIAVDEHTLQSKASPDIFVIGDAADVPASKAGAVAHFEGEIVAHNVWRFLGGKEPDASYDGHGMGFIETGFHKAILLDSNYVTQPLEGHFPAAIGLPLLKESRLDHLAKVEFQWFYWHMLLPGRDIPGLGSAMPMRGKQPAAPGA